MVTTFDTISHQALVLPPAQRMSLARSLIESVESEDSPSPEVAWEAEIQARLARYHAGESTSIPAAEVFRKLREIAPAR